MREQIGSPPFSRRLAPNAPVSDTWPEPDLSVPRLSRRSPPPLPLGVSGPARGPDRQWQLHRSKISALDRTSGWLAALSLAGALLVM
jgi:hypothetical protein